MIDYDKIAGNMRPDCVKDDGPLREPIAKLAKILMEQIRSTRRGI
ncbi:hypothetical protein [Mogibacterium timidum]|uniref:Uncharacterized protein n=1 Tax=Mogibacterium timidum ATCC 33093 TaxID=1401079 RepID=X8ITJ2_9FIRM|nr:hypothetical protein [Mogibacterium timidum]EUC52494.1 hypothetical protein HMPREF0581_1217 [Mogibacterium timidum ATCC 33093]